MSCFTDTELVRRALVAFYRSSLRAGAVPDQPSYDSYETTHEGLTYVVLNNVNGVLAVYRLHNSGVLRRMKRWPKAIEPA